ncbi:MAG: DUF5715 family protein [Gemmatimonadaceae bacterium]
MKSNLIAVAGFAALLAVPSVADAAGKLTGSVSSMRGQHAVAVKGDLEFISDAAQVQELLDKGGLERIESSQHFTLHQVSYPFGVPEVKLFLERLGRQYHEANGTPLVVTSLTRPTSQQPRNAHQLSVHPAGMAVDFRVPQDAKARQWLESVLLQLENRGVLDVTRERFPPHYHVAVFPAQYRAYIEKIGPLPPVVPVTSQETDTPAPAAVLAVTASQSAVKLLPQHDSATVPGAGLLIIGMSGIAFTTLLARRRALPYQATR